MPINNPAAVIWSAIDARCRSDKFEHTMSATVHDPLWTLSTQWRVGEFKGEDAGTPLFVRAHVSTTKVNRFSTANGAVSEYSQLEPIECIIEREPVEMDLWMRVQLGRHFFKVLTQIGIIVSPLLKTQFALAYPLQTEVTKEQESNTEGMQYRNALAGRAFDGGELIQDLNNGMNAVGLEDKIQPGTTNFSDHTLLTDAINAFKDYYKRLFNQPIDNETAWNASKLEYEAKFSLPESNTINASQLVLETKEFHGGKVEWYDFTADASPSSALQEGAINNNVQSSFKHTMLPMGVNFGGVAPDRWWQFHEGNYNFAAMNPESTDTFSTILGDFMMGYNNDWGIIPYTIQKGSLSKVESIVLKDVFGDYIYAGGADDYSTNPSNYEPWNIFSLSRKDNPDVVDKRLFIPFSSAKIMAAEPIERVNLVRDDMAGMAWAVEKLLPNELGGAIDGDIAGQKLANLLKAEIENYLETAPPEETEPVEGAYLKYKLITSVPENWIPLVWKLNEDTQTDDLSASTKLFRARIPRILSGMYSNKIDPDTIHFVAPRTRIMRKGLDTATKETYSIYNDEVQHAGTIIERTYFRTRWHDGSIFTWMGRKRTTGMGGGLSGLKYDLFTTEQENITQNDMANLTDLQKALLLQSLSPTFIDNNLSASQKEILQNSICEPLAYRSLELLFEENTNSLSRLIEIDWTGEIATVVLTNCTATYNLDGVTKTLPFNVTKGQKLQVTVSVTDPGQAAIVDIQESYYENVSDSLTNYAMIGEGRYIFWIDNLSSPNKVYRKDLSDNSEISVNLPTGYTWKSLAYRNINESIYFFAATRKCRLQDIFGSSPTITDDGAKINGIAEVWPTYNTKTDTFVLGFNTSFNPNTNGFVSITGKFENMSRLSYSRYLDKYTCGEYTSRSLRFILADINNSVRYYSGVGGIWTWTNTIYNLYYNFRNGKYYIGGNGNGTGFGSFILKDGIFYLQNIINITPVSGALQQNTSGIDHKRDYLFVGITGLSTGGGQTCTLYVLNMNTDTLVGSYTFTTNSGEAGLAYCMYSTYLDRYLLIPRSATCNRIKVFDPNTLTFSTDISLSVNTNTNLTQNSEECLFALSEINPAMS